mmetsp:Transcript_58132/g.177119  ORF Transcript_58132/g.177119 Transcript_58132/m.177119 type:complete len:217 (+) Transcript_58132:94-744(+)
MAGYLGLAGYGWASHSGPAANGAAIGVAHFVVRGGAGGSSWHLAGRVCPASCVRRAGVCGPACRSCRPSPASIWFDGGARRAGRASRPSHKVPEPRASAPGHAGSRVAINAGGLVGDPGTTCAGSRRALRDGRFGAAGGVHRRTDRCRIHRPRRGACCENARAVAGVVAAWLRLLSHGVPEVDSRIGGLGSRGACAGHFGLGLRRCAARPGLLASG